MYKKTTPILRNEQYVDFKSCVDRVVTDYIKNPAAYPFQTCLNCMYWKPEQDLCGKWNAKPPAEIIVFSCPDYKDDGEIPF
jgi:hypothetical protein